MLVRSDRLRSPPAHSILTGRATNVPSAAYCMRAMRWDLVTSSDLIAGTWWRRIGQGTFALLLLFGPWISQEQPLRFERPPKMRNQAGVIRRVGIEIEFGGLSGKRATELVQRRFGGT